MNKFKISVIGRSILSEVEPSTEHVCSARLSLTLRGIAYVSPVAQINKSFNRLALSRVLTLLDKLIAYRDLYVKALTKHARLISGEELYQIVRPGTLPSVSHTMALQDLHKSFISLRDLKSQLISWGLRIREILKEDAGLKDLVYRSHPNTSGILETFDKM